MKLVIATTTYFGTYQHVEDPEYRRKLWDLYCDSLEASDLSGHNVLLLIHDDASPVEPRLPLNVRTIVQRNSEHVGVQANTILALNEAACLGAKYCLSVDSDAYFAPDWLFWLSSTIEKHPGASGWCLFNSPWHKAGFDQGQWQIKDNVQNHALCYRTKDRRDYKSDEWNEAYISQLPGYGFVVPKISLIQHTGLRGENNVEGVTNDFDPAFPYNEICGLPNVNPKLEETCNAE